MNGTILDSLTLIFAYGTLEKQYDPPHTISLDVDDQIRGCMYDLGAYPAAIKIGDEGEGWIKGQIEVIHSDELKKLDKRESPEYKRIQTKTRKGHTVWVYEWTKPIPHNAVEITEWKEHKGE